MPNTAYYVFVLLKRLALVLLFYTLCRLGFYLFNLHYFNALSFADVVLHFFYGLRFDISAIAFTNTPVIILSILPFRFVNSKWFQHFLKGLFVFINTIAVFFNVIDWIYFRYTLKRTSVELFSLFSLGDDMKNIIPVILLDYWYLLVIVMILVYAMHKLYSRINIEARSNKKYFLNTLLILFTIFATGVAARGGFQYKPMKALAATQYTNSHHAPLILNTPFTIVTNTSKSLIDKTYSNIDLSEIKSDRFIYTKHFAADSSLKGSNVIIFILESFSSEFVGYYNNESTYTPFLDSILQESWVFDKSYANAKKSIDALPSILSSIPSLMRDPFISSAYNVNKVPSIAKFLKSENYYSSFYHGGNNGTMGFDAYTSACGFDNYFGRNEYKGEDEDYDGQWGIYDEPYLTYFSNALSKQKQPFISCFFSLSSHHPFKLPNNYKVEFKDGTAPVYKCIQYTDNALKLFFEKSKNEEWFKNTLFVFTADHTGPTNNPNYLTNENRYAVPIAYYYPSKIKAKKDKRITQHLDIMPTLLDLLGYSSPVQSFGVSKKDSSNANFAVSFANNIYQCIFDEEVLEYDGSNYIAAPKNIENAILNEAIIANYNYRMINNKLANE